MKNLIGLSAVTLGLCVVAATVEAQQYTVNFAVTPPTIDGTVSAGEWDAASSAITTFNSHDSETPEDDAENTSVRVLYSVDGLYVLYECEDTDVVSVVTGTEKLNGHPADTPGKDPGGWTFGGTDYLAIYLDPANVADDSTDVDPSAYSYSLQAEPSITANSAMDADGNSYFYTESQRWGGGYVRNVVPESEQQFAGSGSWELTPASKIKDGASANGYVMEFKIAWEDLDEDYFEHIAGRLDTTAFFAEIDGAIDLNLEPETVWGMVRVDGAALTGMPEPGTVWKAQFCRHSASSTVQYVNWVGSTGSFVTRPFGDIVFGAASTTQIREAMMHINN